MQCDRTRNTHSRGCHENPQVSMSPLTTLVSAKYSGTLRELRAPTSCIRAPQSAGPKPNTSPRLVIKDSVFNVHRP